VAEWLRHVIANHVNPVRFRASPPYLGKSLQALPGKEDFAAKDDPRENRHAAAKGGHSEGCAGKRTQVNVAAKHHCTEQNTGCSEVAKARCPATEYNPSSNEAKASNVLLLQSTSKSKVSGAFKLFYEAMRMPSSESNGHGKE
jgi:hypothetical protein